MTSEPQTLRRLAAQARQPAADHAVRAAYAEALKAQGRLPEAVEVYEQALSAFPQSAVAAHNLAAALGDLGRHDRAETAARRALQGGLRGAATWMVLARALQGAGRLEESEAAFRGALAQDPASMDAHRELAQLVWMRTGDAAAALAALDAALKTNGPHPRLLEVRAIALKFCGELSSAHGTAVFAARRFPEDAALATLASHLAASLGLAAEALSHAQAARALDPAGRAPLLAACEALLGAGEAAQAAALLEGMRARWPLDQGVIAYQAVAWRLLGDPRYSALYDYDRLVGSYTLDAPDGWASLEAYLADLRTALEAAHVYAQHPFQQSLLEGSQITGLLASSDRAIAAFPQAVRGPILRHLEALGEGGDPLRSRNTGRFRFEGLWSVRLRAGGGRHVDHVHPKGWLSSACYIALPDAVRDSTGQEGWLRFGQPGVVTTPALGPQRHVRPEVGRLVLFPSYMWHGVSPFAGAAPRLSVAFDLLPA